MRGSQHKPSPSPSSSPIKGEETLRGLAVPLIRGIEPLFVLSVKTEDEVEGSLSKEGLADKEDTRLRIPAKNMRE